MATNTEKIVVQVVVQGQKDLDRLEKRTGGVTKGFGKMAAGITGAVIAFRQINQVIGGAIRSFRDFEFQMAKVRAVTSASDKDFKVLSKTAKELGRSTFFTAQQVAELQTNFGKLGFSTQEILDAQEATLLLATATDTDLGRAAVVAGASVRGFGLDASETGRIVDVMAVAFRSSALDIEKFQTSMTKVAPIAAGAGISMEATTAVMGALTDAGIEASIAGTSLRNIFLKMQDSSSDLSKHLGFTVQSGEDLQRALNMLNDQALDNEEIMKLVDLRQVAAFRTMIEGSQRIQTLTNDFDNANGEAARMADIVGDTLEGAFKRLKSATEGLAIELTEKLGSGLKDLVNTLADFFNWLTDNSEAIAKIVKGVTFLAKAFIASKVATIALAVATKGLTTAKKAYALATGTADMATKKFIVSLKSMKAAMMKTGVGALIVLAGELAFFLSNLGDEAEDAAEDINKLSEAQQQLLDREQKFNALINQQVGTTIKQSKEIISNLKGEKALRQSALIQHQKGLMTLNAEQKKAFEDEVRRLTQRINLEKLNGQELLKIKKEDEVVSRSLIVEQEKLLDIANRMPETTEAEITAKNRKIESIQKEIDRLKNLGIETKKVAEAKKEEAVATDFLSSVSDDYYNTLTEDVINGTATIQEQEQKLRDFQIDLLNNLLQDEQLTHDQRVQLEKQLNALKLQNIETEKQARQENIDSVAALGDQLINLAGEDKKMQGIRRVGIALSSTAAIANNLQALSEMSLGVAAQAKLPFPANIIGMVTTLSTLVSLFANIKSLGSVFEDGGIVDKYANGGMVHGRSHANGGEKFAVGGRVVELEGGEAVINKRSTAMFRNQLSAMNAAGGGVKFADGGLLNMPSFTQQQFNAIGQSQMMGAMNQQSKVVVVEADITDAQNQVSLIQSEVSF